MSANQQLLPSKICCDRHIRAARRVNVAHRRDSEYRKQQGVSLILALIALIAISLATVALVRSVDTSNVVSGNISTNETTIQMAELGTQAAYTCLASPATCRIYEDVRKLDAKTRLPVGAVIWTAVASPDPSYTIEYVIERMCGVTVGGITPNLTPNFNTDYVATALNVAAPPTFANCTASPVYDAALKLGRLFYRATVRVTGPKNTRAVNSTFIGKDATYN